MPFRALHFLHFTDRYYISMQSLLPTDQVKANIYRQMVGSSILLGLLPEYPLAYRAWHKLQQST